MQTIRKRDRIPWENGETLPPVGQNLTVTAFRSTNSHMENKLKVFQELNPRVLLRVHWIFGHSSYIY